VNPPAGGPDGSRDARAAGFEILRLSRQRVASSSSANPGKVVDIIIDLTKRVGEDDVY
jgi:hypothetical protein